MGEFELIERIKGRLPPPGPGVRLGSGDDAAIVVPDGATVTSVDALVEGVHFRRQHASLPQVGHKALAAALSDLAAMGAVPGEAYAVLGVPTDLDEDGCMELLEGMAALAAATGTTLAGGDVTRAPALTLAMTAVGRAAGDEAFLTRAGAREGDALAVTGELGGAAAGLLALERPDVAAGLPTVTAEALRARQLTPAPRLGAGAALARAGATAMIDLSDGLGGDATRMGEASGVALRIDAASLPAQAGVAELAAAVGEEPLRLIAGGEDYELLAALPAERLEEAATAVADAEGVPLTRIGEVSAGEGVEIRLRGGGVLEPPPGFDQLAPG